MQFDAVQCIDLRCFAMRSICPKTHRECHRDGLPDLLCAAPHCPALQFDAFDVKNTSGKALFPMPDLICFAMPCVAVRCISMLCHALGSKRPGEITRRMTKPCCFELLCSAVHCNAQLCFQRDNPPSSTPVDALQVGLFPFHV